MKYRKIPVVIEAVPVADVLDAPIPFETRRLPEWLREACGCGIVSIADDYVYIRTLEGVVRAQRADWVLQGVKGEIYPCRADIFAATYEPVSS